MAGSESPAGVGKRRAVVVLAAAVSLGAVAAFVVAWRTQAAVIRDLESAWEPGRSALKRGHVPRLAGAWETVRMRADRAKRRHSGVSGAVDRFLSECLHEGNAAIDSKRETILDQVTTRRMHELLEELAGSGFTSIERRLSGLGDELADSCVLVDVEVTGDTNDEETQFFTNEIRKIVGERIAPGTRALPGWPLPTPAPGRLRAVGVTCELTALQFVRRGETRVVHVVPTALAVTFERRSGVFEAQFPEGRFTVGPVEVPRSMFSILQHGDLDSWGQQEVTRAWKMNRMLLTSGLRRHVFGRDEAR